MKTMQQKAVEFIYVVKQRFETQPSKFNEFAKILSQLSCGNSVQDCDSVVCKLKNMFVDDHQDLLVVLDEFLPKNMITEVKDDTKVCDDSKYSWLLSDSPNTFFNKIRDRCIEKNDKEFRVLFKFCELIVACYEKRITVRQVDLEFGYMFMNDPDLYVECTRLLADMWDKSDDVESGLDYSSVGFLNKRRKVVRKRSLYDVTMAVKEFYLYETGLAFSRIESVIAKLEEDPESFEEYFTVHDVRCIVELYKGPDPDYSCGEELVEILRYDPVRRMVAREVVLERLGQKQIQLQEQKLRLDNVWKEIFEDIREKGVVCRHRGFLEQMKEVSKTNYADSD